MNQQPSRILPPSPRKPAPSPRTTSGYPHPDCNCSSENTAFPAARSSPVSARLHTAAPFRQARRRYGYALEVCTVDILASRIIKPLRNRIGEQMAALLFSSYKQSSIVFVTITIISKGTGAASSYSAFCPLHFPASLFVKVINNQKSHPIPVDTDGLSQKNPDAPWALLKSRQVCFLMNTGISYVFFF